METQIVSLAALVISLLVALVLILGEGRRATHEYVEQLEYRIDKLEKELADCTKERHRLLEENLILLRAASGVGND